MPALGTWEYPLRAHESQALGTQKPSLVCHDAVVCLLGFTRSQWLITCLTRRLKQPWVERAVPTPALIPLKLHCWPAPPFSGLPANEPGWLAKQSPIGTRATAGQNQPAATSGTGLGTQAKALHLGRGPRPGDGDGKRLGEGGAQGQAPARLPTAPGSWQQAFPGLAR